jgi:hypothetical protein
MNLTSFQNKKSLHRQNGQRLASFGISWKGFPGLFLIAVFTSAGD